MKDCGIYKIKNIKTGHCYIGQSIHLSKRKSDHFHSLRKNKHYNKHLQSSYNKWGKDSFIFEIIINCESDELTKLEQYYVDTLHPKYNILTECVNSPKGKKFKKSKETRKKISKALKKFYDSIDIRPICKCCKKRFYTTTKDRIYCMKCRRYRQFKGLSIEE